MSLELLSEEPLPYDVSMVVVSSGKEFLIQTVWEVLIICGLEYHNSLQQTLIASKSLSHVAFKDFPSISQSKLISILCSSFIFFIVISLSKLTYLFTYLLSISHQNGNGKIILNSHDFSQAIQSFLTVYRHTSFTYLSWKRKFGRFGFAWCMNSRQRGRP